MVLGKACCMTFQDVDDVDDGDCCCCCRPRALNKRDFKPDDDCD